MNTRKPIIFIAGQLGSGCTEVARAVAKQLELNTQNTELLVRSLVSQFHESFEQLSEDVRSGEVDLESTLVGMAKEVAAKEGTVVEGRSALLVLDRPADLKVFLFREKSERIEFLVKRRNITLDEATREIAKSDREREMRVRELFDLNWMEPTLYDLIINTSRTGFVSATSLILQAIKTKVF